MNWALSRKPSVRELDDQIDNAKCLLTKKVNVPKLANSVKLRRESEARHINSDYACHHVTDCKSDVCK